MFPRDLDEQRRVMYEAQVRTNELIEQLIDLMTPKKIELPKTTVVKPANTRKPPKPRGKVK